MSRNLFKVALLALISLAGCSLVRDQAYNLGYKDRRALDTLRKQSLYSLKANGVFDQKDHELILFDGDTLTMSFANMVNGVENSLAEYSIEVIEDISALEGIYRLYGTGSFSGKYLGMTLLTNNNGAYAKINFQDSPTGILEGARAQAEWNWVTDPLAFRSFKTFPTDVPVVFLSDDKAPSPATGGTNASTKQADLRFIKFAHPGQLSHTNVIASVDQKNTANNLSDDVYTLAFSEVWPKGTSGAGVEVTNAMVTYEIRSVRMIAPNTEIYGVIITSTGTGYTSSPVGTPGSTFAVGTTGFLSIEFSFDSARVKTASRMAFDIIEANALAAMQLLPHFRWESVSTADLPTRVLDRFKGQPVVRVSHYITDDITPNRKAEIPLAYDAENTREYLFDTTNFSVRVLDVANRVTNATTYRFRMVDDTSANEGVIQLQGSMGTLAGQYFHFRHYYPAAGEVNHGYTATPDTFTPGTGAVGTSRPADDVRLLVKIGQGTTEDIAKTAVVTTVNDDANKIVYQSKTNAYKPHRLFVNMQKRGGSWVGVQDDGNYNTEAATNWAINSISRVVQVRISTNAAPRFSTYRVHTLLDISDNRIIAVLSNIKNQTAPGDMRDNFLEPILDPVFPNTDNDANREELSPFHGKYVALELGTGVDNTRAKVEYADSLSEVLKKLDNRTAWNLYESTAVPTPNRIIKTLAGSSPWIRLDKDGFFNSTHTERFNFDADDMTATIFWHRGASASLDNNIVAAAKYSIPLPMEADTSLQEGVFIMRGGSEVTVRVPMPGAGAGGFHPLPNSSAVTVGGIQLEAEDSGAYKYADPNTSVLTYYSAIVGTLADANKARVGKALSRSAADTARVALGTSWSWHTLADAPLSPAVILHLMRTTAENANSPLITSETSYNVNSNTGVPTAGFVYKPYITYEYEFANSPSLQVTVRRIEDTTTTTAIYPLVIVNNVDKSKTIVRLGGTASLGNYAPNRFMLIRISDDVDTTAVAPGTKKYATNAAITVFPTQADAENYTAPITTVAMGQIAEADFNTKYNIRLKSVVTFNQAQLPFAKTYQLLLPHKIGAAEFYDTYDLFNPNFLASAFVRFTNVAVAPATEYRIDIKDANNLDYSSYTYEVMAEGAATADNTLYVKLSGEGGLYHNRFAAFRFDRAHNQNPEKMHAIIGQGIFATLSNMLAAQRTTESTTGWRYRDLGILTNKDFLTFKALANADRTSTRIGSFVRVDKNGVFRSQDTDIFKFEFPTAAGESVTNMQISATIKKTDGTENTARYYFIPLKGTPTNNGIGANHGGSAGTGSGVNDIKRGYLMHGYMISVNFGVDGSATLVPYNNHFVILRTDVTNNPADANSDLVQSVIIATNSGNLGTNTDAITETSATTAYGLYNFWWSNGTNVIGGSPIPGLAFNFRAQASTDINSRVIDFMAVNRWVTLTNIPANSFGAGSAALRYAYDPQNHQVWDFNALTRRVTITNVSNGTATAGIYDIKMQEADTDYEGYVQLSTATGSLDDTFNQRFVYLQVPGSTPETEAVTDRRTRDARIIMGSSAIIGTGTTAVANNITALKQAKADIVAEAPTAFGEWNSANHTLAAGNEQAFRSFHRKGRSFFTYESGTAAVDPSANNRASSDQWNPDHWLSFMPLVRQRNSTDSSITNLLLQRRGLADTDYQFTNVIKLMQADAGRTVLQIAGTNAEATSSVNFSNLFMGVEYGNDVNDRTAKVVYSATRAGVIEALNLRTTYNYFDSEMATNSKNNEQLVEVALGAVRGYEWVQVSNTIHNPANANPPGIAGLPGSYGTAIAASVNIGDNDPYDNVVYDAAATTNFHLDPASKIVREMRIINSTTNTFVYGYTVIESGLVPNIGGLTTRQDNTRYRFVLRLEGFGDYKNLFAAGEIGRFDASAADPTPDSISKGSTAILGAEDERYKVRLIFGNNVAQAKGLLAYLQGSSTLANAPTAGSWNLVSKTILTMPSPLLDGTDTKSGYPTAPATRPQGLNLRTGESILIDPANPTLNTNYYSRLASATGFQSNVIDPDNHTNFAFWNENSEPVVFITTVQSNVTSTVRYKAIVKENYFKSPVASRRSNDVILWLDNLGSPLHSQYIGIRRHIINPNSSNNDLKGDYFSMIIDPVEATVQTAMGNINLVAGSAGLTNVLPMTVRFSNDMARVAGGDNPAGILPNQIIEHFTNSRAGTFASFDADGIYMNLSNAQWNYDANTKLMTITYTSPSGTYADPFTGNDKTTAESYRVIPVLTLTSDNNRSKGTGVVLFRSDLSAGGLAGDLHNKYIGIYYHGDDTAASAHTGAHLVYLNHTNAITNAQSDLTIKGGSQFAQFTTLAPYIGMDLSPLNRMMAVRDPDDDRNLPGAWALLNTGSTAVKRYQLDPSNTTLYKVNMDNRILYEEKVTTTLGAGNVYAGTPQRSAAQYRINLVRSIPSSVGVGYRNSPEQLTFVLVRGKPYNIGEGSPIMFNTINSASIDTNDKYMIIRTKKRISTSTASPVVWEDISTETLYIAVTNKISGSSYTFLNNFLDAAANSDPYGVAAFTATVPRNALNYWNVFMVQNDWWFGAGSKNTFTTNTFDPITGVNPDNKVIYFDANTGNGGSGHGDGGSTIGVVNVHVGFQALGIVAGDVNAARTFTGRKMLNFWQRLIREVDADTFIFQLYGGQDIANNNGNTNYTSGGISYTASDIRSVVSNKYWIVRSGQGVDLYRSRITNGATAAEALQNLGLITSPNLSTDRGLNRHAYNALPKGVDYIGNAEVDPTGPNPADGNAAMALSSADQTRLYAARAPMELEVDNYTNWNFGVDTNNPSVTITIRSNIAGVVGEQTVTYGVTPIYTPTTSESWRSLYALTGFGSFAGRIFSVVLNQVGGSGPTAMRIVMAPASLTRGLDPSGSTNTNLGFLITSMNSALNDQNQSRYTWRANISQGATNWDRVHYFNFSRKSDLAVDAGILSYLDNADNRIVFKTGVFSASNTTLIPKRIYDADVTTNYAADTTTSPPTIIIQPVGQSASTHPMGGASLVETITDTVVGGDNGSFRATGVIGALRIGSTSEYLGIKILTTNGGIEGNAGIQLIRRTDTASDALQNTLDEIEVLADIPNHDYIKNVVTTSKALEDLEGAGTITSLNYYRGFDVQNSLEWSFNKTAATVIATRLTAGAIDRTVVYKAVLVKDFAKLSTETPLNDTSDLYAAILLKSTSSGADPLNFANKIFFIRRKANTNDAPLSKNDFKITIGDMTNTGLTNLDGIVLNGNWTNTTKNLFTGGDINGITYALPTTTTPNPANMAIPQTNFQLLSTLFGGHWSKLHEQQNNALDYLYRKTDTTEYLFDNVRKLAIQRSVVGGTTNTYLFSVWLTNQNPTVSEPVASSGYTASDNLSAGDRGTFYLQTIGRLSSLNTGHVFSNLNFDAKGMVLSNSFNGNSPDPSSTPSKFLSFKFGHNEHITRAVATTAALGTSLAVVFPPDTIDAQNIRYRDLYDTLFLATHNGSVTEAIKTRRIQEFKDPYFIPALQANASELLLVNAARQIQAQGSSTPVNEHWKSDVVSNMYPIGVGGDYYLQYDFNSGSGNGNSPGLSYNINVNIALGASSAVVNAVKTNITLGFGDASGALAIASGLGRAKFLIRTIEANADGTEGVVSFYFGRNLQDYLGGSAGGSFDLGTWNRATNQNQANGLQLSNRYLAIKIGTGSDIHTAKFVWGNTVAEAKANMAAQTHYNMAAFGMDSRLSDNTMKQFKQQGSVAGVLATDAYVGKFVYGSTDNYTIYTRNDDDVDARVFSIWKTSEKPTTAAELRRNQYQYKELFFENGFHSETTDGSYFDTFGGGENSDGTRVGTLIGFGPLSGRIIRFRGVAVAGGNRGGFTLQTFNGLPNNLTYRHLRIARNTFELTNQWKTPLVSDQTNATNATGAAF